MIKKKGVFILKKKTQTNQKVRNVAQNYAWQIYVKELDSKWAPESI